MMKSEMASMNRIGEATAMVTWTENGTAPPSCTPAARAKLEMWLPALEADTEE